MADYRAIILAAGQGTRLRPLTNDIPKCLVKVSGKSLLNWQIELFVNCGIKEIIVATGYEESKIPSNGITKICNEEYASTNMVHTLFKAEQYLEGNVIISYGDIIYSETVLKTLMEDDHNISIISDEKWKEYWEMRLEDPLKDAETFKKADNRKVSSLGQNPQSVDEIEGQFIGLVKLNSAGCSKFKEVYHTCKENEICRENAWGSNRPLKNAYMTDILNFLATRDELYYCPVERGWFEVDTQQDLVVANQNIEELAAS